MRRQKSKLLTRLLVVGLLFTIILSVACTTQPEYIENSSQTSEEDGTPAFNNSDALFIIDLGEDYGVTEIHRASDTLLYALDPSDEYGANAASDEEIVAVLQELNRNGYSVHKIEASSSILFIYLDGYNDTATTNQNQNGTILLMEDILGE